MSKIAIQGTTVGLGTVTVTAPNTANDRTVVLPDLSGTILVDQSNSNAITITAAGYLVPNLNATYDLGTAGLRWRNIYTNDLQLSNGIGDYTIVEGEEDLFLYNNKTNKVFKFALIEVDPKTAPPKANT
jgi:hypothetical protein